jgi:hypothetical protein
MAKSEAEFQHPSELKGKERRVPVSARVSRDVDKGLDSYSKDHGVPKSTLIEHAILAYWKWLQKRESSK